MCKQALRASLEKAGIEDLLVGGYNKKGIDITKIQCDYYDYIKSGTPKFFGEYMNQYSWAEETCAMLLLGKN